MGKLIRSRVNRELFQLHDLSCGADDFYAMFGWIFMMLRSCHTLVAVIISLLGVIVLGGFTYDAHAVTVITVDDEDSCLALPLSGGTATWEFATCIIPDEATLQIEAGEVLELQVSLGSYTTSPSIIILQGGTFTIHSGATLGGNGDFDNLGTLNIRSGGALFLAQATFNNAPSGIINNYGSFSGTSENPHYINEGTINNYASGTIDGPEEVSLRNEPQGVINNFGVMDLVSFQRGLVNDGTLNNYAIANFANFFNEVPAPRDGVINNFGTISLGHGYYNVETISNYGDISIDGGDEGVVNDGTIINKAAGVIENFGKFSNLALINNQGTFSNYCDSTFTNTGTFTGNPVKNACDRVPPEISAPRDETITTRETRIDLCQDSHIERITAIGDDGAGNVAANTLDNNLGTRWSHGGAGSWITPDLGSKEVICSLDIAWYKGNQRVYNFEISISDNGKNFKKIFTGHSSGTTLSPERYEFTDSVGDYVKITVNANSVNTFASVTEIGVNGYHSFGIPDYADNLDPSPLVTNNVSSRGLPLGSHTVIWTATDANGNSRSVEQLVKVVPFDITKPTISITSPATGSTITGPSSGVKVIFKGTAADAVSGVKAVQLKGLTNGAGVHVYHLATPASPNNWSTWSHTVTFTEAGTYTITARATDESGNQNWHVITIKIAFASDTVKPTVSITSPQNGASFSGPSSVPKKISLAGIAADSGSGVQKVELKSLKSGVVVHAYQQASTSNNWATWTRTLSFTESGTYTITARVTDIAGNQNWHSITVNITLR